jgi:hypothetical protein
MTEEKSSGTDDFKGIPTHIASQRTHAYRLRSTCRLLRTLARFTLLSVSLFTLYIWSGGKFDRFTGGEEDLWMVDAFVRHGYGKYSKGGPLRGKAAEKLYL